MCKVKAKVRGKAVTLQTIGYRGRRERKSPIADARQARSFIVYKKDVRKLRLKIGSTVTVNVGGKKIKAKVRKWSRGSRLLLPKSQYPLKGLSTRKLKKVVVG